MLEACQGDRPVGDAGGEVGGAIEGIDNPVRRREWNPLIALLAQHPFLGIEARQAFHEGRIAPTVTGGDQGTIRLVGGSHGAEVGALTLANPIEQGLQTREESGAGRGGPGDRGIEGVGHDHSAVSTFARLRPVSSRNW